MNPFISKLLWIISSILLITSFKLFPGAIDFNSDIIFDIFYVNSVLENGLLRIFLDPFINLDLGWPASAHFDFPLNEWVSLLILSTLNLILDLETYSLFGYFVIIGLVLNFVSFYLLTLINRIHKSLGLILSIAFALNLFFMSRFSIHIFFTQLWIVNFGLILFFILLNDRLKNYTYIKIIMLFFCSLILAYSNNYFILFTLILYTLLLLFFITKLLFHSKTIQDLYNVVYVICLLFLTLSFNSLSTTSLFTQPSSISLLTTADSRQIVESIMFSGSPFSLFSYQNSIIYQIFNVTYLEYAQDYSILHPGWGDSLGNRFEIQILILVIITIFVIQKTKRLNLLDTRLKVLIIALLISFSFYIQGGLGYFFASIISNSVRGWGRIILIILILGLLITGICLTKILQIFQSRLISMATFLLLSVFLIIPAALDLSRLSNSQIVEVYESEQSDLRGVFSSLSSLEDNCPVVVLPYYPFPEFDSPNDRLSDYDLLALPMIDVENKFKWNVGAIKWSEDDRWWSPLASDIPGFASADALTQISFASHYGACAIALNQGMFKTQDLEVKPSFLTQFECPLLGNFPNSTPANSWMVWDIRGKTCQDKILINAKLAPNTFPNDPDGPLLWRFTNISPEKYEANYPIFSSRSPVGIDFMSMSNKERADKPKLAIKIMENQENEILNLKICVTEIEKMNEECEEIEIKGNETDYQLKKYLTGKKHHINITPKTAQNEIKWAPLITY